MQDIRAEDIAVIGMAGRFPGANTLDEFWHHLCSGRETIHRFTDAELQQTDLDESVWRQANYIKAKGIVDKVEWFDAPFFGMSALEAKILDPQQRLFLMCAWEVLENAGYLPKQTKNRVGVFASTGMSFYLLKNILTNPLLLQQVDEYQLLLSNDKDFLATRVSYLLNLQGPSVNIQTGCSSSLVCVHYACQSLLSGECNVALAGGVSITVPQEQGYVYKKEMIGSPDGHCYAFDERAQGTIKSNGVGIVLLKPLSDAVRDHDHIYAVIKGTAINNDGANKVGYTAPSVTQQAAVIKEALQMADLKPNDIEYIEAHGTGTLLGDPIEIAALKQVFPARANSAKCAIASLKTNLGHLDVAAGIGGLIKACLAVYHGKLPASLNFTKLNPKINLTDTPFYINTELKNWQPQAAARYAGVSAFGIGGTNVHVVIQQPPVRTTLSRENTAELLVFSARSKESLIANMQTLAEYLQRHPHLAMQDVAYTLQHGREIMPYRAAVLANTATELAEQVAGLDKERLTTIKTPPVVVFMFSGQGSQYPGMGKELYQTDAHFQQALDECVLALQPYMQQDLKQLLFSYVDNHEQLKQTAIAQPALFAIEYALAKCYLAQGVKPSALIGHSIGEYTAAVIAGIFTLADAAKLIVLRGQLVQSLPRGSMLAVYASVEKMQALLPANLDIALVNAPDMTVLSGTNETIIELSKVLEGYGIRSQFLHTSHAFHSRMLEPILTEFANLVAATKRSAPTLPIACNVTGDWMTVEQAISVDYWVAQLRHTVNFSPGLQCIQQQYAPIFIEVGPGRVLQSLAYKHGITKAFNSLPQPSEDVLDHTVFMHTLAQLWNAGIAVNVNKIGLRIPLPTYQWNLERHWIAQVKLAAMTTPETNIHIEAPLDLPTLFTQAWQAALGTDSITEEDHFFNLGGNSLAAIQFIDRLPMIWQERISVVHLYQYPKFGDLMAYATSLQTNNKNNQQHAVDNCAEQQLFAAAEEL